jgi:hypothetical protein
VSANETDTSAANIAKVVAARRKSNIEGLLSDWCDNAAQTAWFGNEWQFFQLLRRAHNGLVEEEKRTHQMIGRNYVVEIKRIEKLSLSFFPPPPSCAAPGIKGSFATPLSARPVYGRRAFCHP